MSRCEIKIATTGANWAADSSERLLFFFSLTGDAILLAPGNDITSGRSEHTEIGVCTAEGISVEGDIKRLDPDDDDAAVCERAVANSRTACGNHNRISGYSGKCFVTNC